MCSSFRPRIIFLMVLRLCVHISSSGLEAILLLKYIYIKRCNFVKSTEHEYIDAVGCTILVVYFRRKTLRLRCNICKQIIIYLLYKSGMLAAGIRNILKLLTVDGICRCAATQPTSTTSACKTNGEDDAAWSALRISSCRCR